MNHPYPYFNGYLVKPPIENKRGAYNVLWSMRNCFKFVGLSLVGLASLNIDFGINEIVHDSEFVVIYGGLMWPMRIPIVFQRPLTVC